MYYHDIRTYNNYLYLFLRLFNFNSKIKLYNIMNIISSNYNPFNILYNSITYIWNNDAQNYIKRPNHEDVKNLKLIIFNVDGVLSIGENPIEIARASFNKLIKLNIPICIITNEDRRSPKRIKKGLKLMGFNINEDIKIITAGLLMLYHISSIINPLTYHIINRQTKSEFKNHKKIFSSRKRNFAVIGEQDFFHYVKQNTLNRYDNVKFHWIYDDTASKNIDYFVIGSLNNTDNILEIINRIIKWIKLNQKAKFVITTPDIINVENNKILTTILPNMILKIVKDEFAKEENMVELIKHINLNVEYPSKPNPIFIRDEIEYNYNIKIDDTFKNNIMIIGDNIETDIKLGEQLNCFKSLVLCGVTKHTELYKLTKREQNNIDYIIPDISYLIL